MRETEVFVQMMLGAQCNKAKEFLRHIYENNSRKYADSLVTVVMVQTNRELQLKIKEYYIDEKYILDNSEYEKVFGLVDKLCNTVKNSGKEKYERIFHKAVSYIKSNLFDSKLYVGGVAEFAGVSGSLLSKFFEERMGITPARYIATERVKKSVELLNKGVPIKEVAQQVGFSSAEAYIRAFKKTYGETPGRYKYMKINSDME